MIAFCHMIILLHEEFFKICLHVLNVSFSWLIAMFTPCVLKDNFMIIQGSFMKDTKWLWKRALLQWCDSKRLDNFFSSLI